MSELASSLAEQFREHANKLPGAGQPRIVEMRERAFSQFEANGVPTAKLEDWKYIDTRALGDSNYIAINESNDLHSDAVQLSDLPLPEFTPHVAVFLDGEFCTRLSSLDALPKGVHLTTIGPLLQQESAQIIGHMNNFDTAFPSLNTALLSDGVYVDLEPDTVLLEPLHVIFLVQRNDTPRLNTVRLIVVGKENSRGTIVESHYCLDGAHSMTNAVTEIEAQQGANVVQCTRVTLRRCLSKPLSGLLVVNIDTLATITKRAPNVVLCPVELCSGALSKPAHSLLVVLRNSTYALLVHASKAILRHSHVVPLGTP